MHVNGYASHWRASVSRLLDTFTRLVGAIVVSTFVAAAAEAQVYGYTDENGVLVLSNVPAGGKMRLIVDGRDGRDGRDGTAEEAGKTWRYSGQYDAMILKASRLFGVDSSLVRAIIAVESAFNRYARSNKGARGLMQLMPATGRRYGVVNAYDPWQNIRGGTAHLRDLMDEFDDLHLTLAAYNAGPTPVRRYRSIPPYKETRNYVRKVMAIYRAGSKIQIVKGGKTYSIERPGGKTRVTQFHGGGAPTENPGASPSSLGEIARRNRQRSATATFQSPKAVAKVRQGQHDKGKLVYYRYVDPEGVVRITRERPATYPYDVLDP